MKSKSRLITWIHAATAALALYIVQPCSAVVPNPKPIDLGVLSGCASSEAFDINAAGQVVGACYGPDVPALLPFIWQAGVLSQLPLPEGCTQAAALAINASGSVVGMCIKETKNQACLWTPNKGGWAVALLGDPTFTMTDPGQPDLVFTFTEHAAMKINGAGQVLVLAMIEANEGTRLSVPVIWHKGAWTFLTDENGVPVGNEDPRLN